MRFCKFFIKTLILDAGTKKNFFHITVGLWIFAVAILRALKKQLLVVICLFQFSHWKVKTNAEVLKSSNTFLFLHTYSHTVWVSWLCIYYCLPQKPKGPTCIVLTQLHVLQTGKIMCAMNAALLRSKRLEKHRRCQTSTLPLRSCRVTLI